MANESIILSENENIFSPVSVLHYSFYKDEKSILGQLKNDENVQCVVGKDRITFGEAQKPDLFDYADRIDTMEFLLSL